MKRSLGSVRLQGLTAGVRSPTRVILLGTWQSSGEGARPRGLAGRGRAGGRAGGRDSSPFAAAATRGRLSASSSRTRWLGPSRRCTCWQTAASSGACGCGRRVGGASGRVGAWPVWGCRWVCWGRRAGVGGAGGRGRAWAVPAGGPGGRSAWTTCGKPANTLMCVRDDRRTRKRQVLVALVASGRGVSHRTFGISSHVDTTVCQYGQRKQWMG